MIGIAGEDIKAGEMVYFDAEGKVRACAIQVQAISIGGELVFKSDDQFVSTLIRNAEDFVFQWKTSRDAAPVEPDEPVFVERPQH